MKVIAVANQKGGVGKSTTAQTLGAGLSQAGKKVLFIDLDPQGNMSYSMGADINRPGSSYSVLTQRMAISDAVQHVADGDILTASSLLSGADSELDATGKEYRLKEVLGDVEEEYDIVVIDTPPALGVLTVNALTAADTVIVPAHADVYSLQGIGQLHETIEVVKKYCNPNLKVSGFLLTRHNKRTILSRDMKEHVKKTAESYGSILYKTIIRESITVKEAQANRLSIFAYDPNSNPGQDYAMFIKEFRERENI